jgi:hypothetical protein
MFSALRRRLTFANVAMTLALVFAMSGGAYAASKFTITSTRQISPKVLKSLKGANGKNGAPGPAGATGAAGPQGPAGLAGPAGTRGETGPAGPAGATGKEGKAGKEGSPWTVGGTLPHGESETGVWGLNATTKPNQEVQIPISFTIPLSASLDAAHVHLIGLGEATPQGCAGSAEKPEAEPGNVCIWGAVAGMEFKSILTSSVEDFSAGAGKNGLLLETLVPIEGASGRGEWVVSGP